jgi:hypothetical protein
MSSAGPLELYADVLWNTGLLPNSITVGSTTYQKRAPGQPPGSLAASINGVVVQGRTSNPPDGPASIVSINKTITYWCYGGEEDVVVFDCLTTSIPYPSRFIIINGTVTAGTQTQVADQVIVTSTGQHSYLATDWRSPPAYAPGPLAT